jgi:hypothetical protein
VTGDRLAAGRTGADILARSLCQRIHGCQLCCRCLEAGLGLGLLGTGAGQIGLQLPDRPLVRCRVEAAVEELGDGRSRSCRADWRSRRLPP